MRLLATLALTLLLPLTASAQTVPVESPDRRASYIQGSVNGALTYLDRADSIALSVGDTLASRQIRQARGRVRAILTHTLILRVLLRDTLATPPVTPPVPVDTIVLPIPDPPPVPVPPPAPPPIPEEEEPEPIPLPEPDADPAAGPPPAAVDTTGPRMHVVEDVRSQGNVVSLQFRPGWATHDSIQATSTAGTLTRSGLNWTLASTQSALVTLRVWQTLPDQLGRTKTASPVYYAWVQIGAPREVQIPTSFDATGNTDVCAVQGNQLEQWLATVPNGSVIRGADGARYRCDYGIALDNRWNLAFTGAVTLFTLYDADRNDDSARQQFRLLRFVRGGNITIDGWTFQGPRPAGAQNYVVAKETQHALEFNGTNGVALRDVTVRDVYGDFVALGFDNSKWGEGLFASEPTRHAEIDRSAFWNAGRQGLGITGLFDGRIHDSTWGEVQRTLWDFEPGGKWEWVQDVDIYSNRITGRIRNNVVAGHGSGLWMQNVTIRDNEFGPKTFRMSFGGNIYRRGLRILRNTAPTVFNASGSPIEISGIDEVEVVGNVMPMEPRRANPAIVLQNQRHGPEGNVIQGNSAPGARVMWRWEQDKRDPLTVVIEDGVQVAP